MSAMIGDVLHVYNHTDYYQGLPDQVIECVNTNWDSGDPKWRGPEVDHRNHGWHTNWEDWMDCEAELLI